jgi:hypothetical protein
MRIFNREFKYLDSAYLQDLQTLRSEGAIYAQFWQDDISDLRFCRIRFTPEEIVAYLDATVAFDEFQGFNEQVGDPSIALAMISDKQIKKRVEQYNEWTVSIGQEDTVFCYGAFLGEHLEALVCGGIPDRYEYLTKTYTGDRYFILIEILEMFATSAGYISKRAGNRPSYQIEEEQDVRDLLYAIIKSVFPDARIEEYTRTHAGSAKRIDIVIPRVLTVIEIKYVRNANHAKNIADELRVDFESYHIYPNCKKVIAYVWDPKAYLVDRSNFVNDLRGARVKGSNQFNVDVMVKP